MLFFPNLDDSLLVMLAAFPGAALFALIVERMGARHALCGPLAAEIRSLSGYREITQNNTEREQIDARMQALKQEIIAAQSQGGNPSIWKMIFLFAVFSFTLMTIEPLAKALGACVLLCLLWRVVATDRAGYAVLDVDVFWIGLAGAMMTSLSSTIRWTDPSMALLGFMTVGGVVVILGAYFLLKGKLLQVSHQPFLGDGDTLLLFALSIYFGLDVLTVLFFASLFALGYMAGAKQSKRFAIPFVPSIFFGCVATIATPVMGVGSINEVASRIMQVM